MKKRVLKIERKRLTDQIIEHIVSMISGGELKAGDMLPPEPELMRQFGVGRGSLREAIGALSLTGILSVRPGHGTQVVASDDTFLKKPLEWSASIRNETVEELIEARIVIEEAVAGVAAAKATDEDIAELKHILEQIDAVKKNKKKTVQYDVVFHLAVAKASHNRVLLRTVSELKHLMRTWMEQNATFVGTRSSSRLYRRRRLKKPVLRCTHI
jgi:GntR family transcriptional repressor for pyruvate dehydrogenase complex